MPKESIKTPFSSWAPKPADFGYKRGSRLYSTHPTLFKYTLDQEDKDRLIHTNVIPLNSVSKRVNVLIVEDIIEIAENMQVAPSGEILQHSFKCPPGMIDKMKIFIDLVKTDPSESDESLLKKVAPPAAPANASLHARQDNNLSEEDLGFLQNMNLTSLVREFEMEASGQGSQHLGSILSLADDSFSELEGHHQANGTMTDSLNDIGFE